MDLCPDRDPLVIPACRVAAGATPEDTGLVVVPGSHKRWKSRASGTKGTRHKSGFAPLRRDEPDFEEELGRAVKLHLPENCLVLWNSRTLHGTAPGTRERPFLKGSGPEDEAAASDDAGGGGGDVALPCPNRLTCVS